MMFPILNWNVLFCVDVNNHRKFLSTDTRTPFSFDAFQSRFIFISMNDKSHGNLFWGLNENEIMVKRTGFGMALNSCSSLELWLNANFYNQLNDA